MRESLIRTFVPLLVGALGPFLTGWFGWTSDDVSQVAGLLVAGMYYLGARLLERYVAPQFGWLLGLAKAPQYQPPVTAFAAGARRDPGRRS